MSFRQELVRLFATNSIGMTLDRYPSSLSLIIEHISNTLDPAPRITGQISSPEFKQDIRKIDHHSALGLPRLKIASLEFFQELAVTCYLLVLPLDLLLARCKLRIAFLKPVTDNCAGDTP